MIRTWLRSRLNHRLPWGPRYHSRFGGLVTDRLDARTELARRSERGQIPAGMLPDLERFVDQGYVILEGAVSHVLVDALRADVERAWSGEDPGHVVERQRALTPVEPGLRDRGGRLLDIYRHSHAAREAMFAPRIAAFLNTIFEAPAIAFQSLSFDRGSEQRIHQDTAYVVVSEPMKLAASWIALEDVQEGTGELEYFEGSHRLPDYPFPKGRKSWKPSTDGDAVHDRFLDVLTEESEKRGLPRRRFLPKKGDALIWAADLAHGGSPITQPGTRTSLVTHYCPITVRPNYMRRLRGARTIRTHREGCAYVSELDATTGFWPR